MDIEANKTNGNLKSYASMTKNTFYKDAKSLQWEQNSLINNTSINEFSHAK